MSEAVVEAEKAAIEEQPRGLLNTPPPPPQMLSGYIRSKKTEKSPYLQSKMAKTSGKNRGTKTKKKKKRQTYYSSSSDMSDAVSASPAFRVESDCLDCDNYWPFDISRKHVFFLGVLFLN